VPEPDPGLTLSDAAERLGVHYMTVYRYVRLGIVPARKVGGSWRIRAADLPVGPIGGRPATGPRSSAGKGRRRPRRAPWPERLKARMLAGDMIGSWAVVEAAMASGMEPPAVYVELLGPTLHVIGNDWSAGRIGVEQEHLASGVAWRLVGRLASRFARRGRSRGTVIVAMPSGERHGLGATMVGQILAGEGFHVLELGADTPTESLVAAVRDGEDVVAVVLSVVLTDRLPTVARQVGAVHRTDAGVPVFVGGYAVPDRATADRLGADGWVSDPRDLGAAIEARRSSR
jgi:excisionase family DNA binding protein